MGGNSISLTGPERDSLSDTLLVSIESKSIHSSLWDVEYFGRESSIHIETHVVLSPSNTGECGAYGGSDTRERPSPSKTVALSRRGALRVRTSYIKSTRRERTPCTSEQRNNTNVKLRENMLGNVLYASSTCLARRLRSSPRAIGSNPPSQAWTDGSERVPDSKTNSKLARPRPARPVT